jgi:hypothetical protein
MKIDTKRLAFRKDLVILSKLINSGDFKSIKYRHQFFLPEYVEALELALNPIDRGKLEMYKEGIEIIKTN